MTSQIASLEIQLKQQVLQQDKLEAELASVRDLCVKLDKQKDNLSRELREKDSRQSQMEREMDRLMRDSDAARATLSKDRDSVEYLEKLLADSRQENVELKIINQELQSEILRLKNKIEELQNKL